MNAGKGAIFAILLCAVAGTSARAQMARDGIDASSNAIDSRRMFFAAGQLYSLDPDLLAAIAKIESGGNPTAVSPKGAQGLMQLMPATAARFRVHDPFDPVSNTLGAARFISFLRQYRIENGAGDSLSLPEMIAAYNAGEGAVQKYGGIPPYPETQDYVRKVLLAYLFGDTHSDLATRLGARPPAPMRTRAHRSPVAAAPKAKPEPDPLDKLTEIQHLRELEVSRQSIKTTSNRGGDDGVEVAH